MVLSAELINDNGTSSVAFAFFTALLGAVTTIIGLLLKTKSEAREAAQKADEARVEATKAKENTVNVSNGFASGVDKRLEVIVTTLQGIDEAMRDHLQWHLEQEGKKK